MYSNGEDLRQGRPYAQLEVLNSDFGNNHFPQDAGTANRQIVEMGCLLIVNRLPKNPSGARMDADRCPAPADRENGAALSVHIH
mgnify:CR=1 FL=1